VMKKTVLGGIFGVLGGLAALGAPLGCSASGVSPITSESSDGGITHAQGSDSFCGRYCDRVSSCDNAKDNQTCSDACSNQNAATVPKLRGDVVDLISKCLDSEDCKTVLSTNVVGTCANEAAAQVAPSTTATTFCDAYASSSTKCGTGSRDKAQCLTRAKLYNDVTLAKAKDCTSKACSDVDTCVDAALGSVSSANGTNGSGTGSSGSGSSTGGSGGTGSGGTGSGSGSGTGTGGTGGSGGSGGGSGGTCPAVSDSTTTCGMCVSSSCCTEFSACVNDSSCNSLLSCLDSCAASDTTCRNNCGSTYPSGITPYNTAVNCVSSYCPSACP
jgi:hypothetical protein